MNQSGKRTLLAGLALIGLVNAIALGGVAYNRSGAESELQLTQRELSQPYQSIGMEENSGISLRIQWRVLDESRDTVPGAWGVTGYGGTASWLDAAKLQSLGFGPKDLELRKTNEFRQPEPREVFLVLEFDGPAYQRALDRARRYAENAEAKNKQAAENGLQNETTQSSRLFVVDAGLAAEELRAKYPDTHRYAVVRGQVRPQVATGRAVQGYVAKLSVDTVNVPFEFRSVFDPARRIAQYGRIGTVPPLAVTIAYGKRFEPWIVAVSKP